MTESPGQPAYFIDAHGTKSADAARQILDTTRPFRSQADDALDVLDVGCGFGHTALALAQKCRRVVAIEPNPALYREAVRGSSLPNIELSQRSIDDVDEENVFDLIVLDNVLEHIADQKRALRIVAAALKSGGILYLLVPNKLWPFEAHYGLPFLSYLPLALANRYVRLTRKADDYTDASHAPTYSRLRWLLDEAGFESHFVVPADLSLTVGGAAWHYRFGAALLRRAPWLWRFSKGFLVVAIKRQTIV